PAFLARADAPVPQVGEGREARLERGELEALHLRVEPSALEALDGLLEPATALVGRARQAPGKVHRVLGLELAQVGREALQLAIDGTRLWHGQGPPAAAPSARQQEPGERQPQLPRVRQRTIVHEDLAPLEPPDDREQVTQLLDLVRTEPGANPERLA